VSSLRASRLMRRGVRVVTRRRGGLRWTCGRRQTTGAGTDGEIVWSWPPGAEAKSALRRARGRRGQESRSPGRSRISRNPLAQGRPGCLGQTCGDCRLRSLLQAGHGCGQRPAFPAPSRFSRASVQRQLGRIAAARLRSHAYESLAWISITGTRWL
jgi:hypothetical protein